MKLKRVLTVTLISSMILSEGTVYAAQPSVITDEAVYVNLDYYGAVSGISIVKSCDLNDNKEFIDYGNYEKVTNMTNFEQPTINVEGITWRLSDTSKRFYYECTPKQNTVVLPWDFDISYKLNGVPKKAEELAGAEGLVEIKIEAVPNLKVNDYYKNNMLLQVATMVNTEDIISLEAPGAQLQSIGTYKAVVFAGLPGEHITFDMRIGSKSFESTGITMMMVPGTLKQLKDIKELKESKDKVQDSANAVNDSLNDILGTLDNMTVGLKATQSGLSSLDDARNTISSSKEEVYQNADKALDDLSKLTEQLDNIVPHLQNGQKFVDKINEDVNAIIDTIQSTKKHVSEYKESISEIQKNVIAFQDMLSKMDDLKEKRQQVFQDMEDSLRDLSKSMEGMRSDTRNMAATLNELTLAVSDLKGAARSLGSVNYYTADAATSIMMSLVYGGLVSPEEVEGLGYTVGNIKEEMSQIEDSLYKTADKMVPFLTSTEKTLRDLKDSLESGSNMANTLKQATQLGDEYFNLLEENYESADSFLDQLNEIGDITQKSLDCATTSIDNITVLNDTLNSYEEGTITMLKDSEELTRRLSSSMVSTLSFLNSFERVLKISGQKLDEGTQKTLNGLIDVLGKSIEGIGKTDTIRNANSIIKETIDKELYKYEEDSNLLNMDSEQPMVSFTSDKNKTPDSIQILLRTEEISIDEDKDDNLDLEKEKENTGVFDRIGKVFKKIWDKIVSIF